MRVNIKFWIEKMLLDCASNSGQLFVYKVIRRKLYRSGFTPGSHTFPGSTRRESPESIMNVITYGSLQSVHRAAWRELKGGITK